MENLDAGELNFEKENEIAKAKVRELKERGYAGVDLYSPTTPGPDNEALFDKKIQDIEQSGKEYEVVTYPDGTKILLTKEKLQE